MDPNDYEVIEQEAPSYNTDDFEVVQEHRPLEMDLEDISKKYSVPLEDLKSYARGEGSFEASEGPLQAITTAAGKFGDVVLGGMPQKLVRKGYGAFAGDNWEKALDEVHQAVAERKSGWEIAGETAASLVVPTSALGKATQGLGYVGKGVTGVIAGAATGYAQSTDETEGVSTILGGALGGAAGLLVHGIEKYFSPESIAKTLIKPKKGEEVEDFVRKKSKIKDMLKEASDSGVYKGFGTDPKKIVDNVDSTIEKLSTDNKKILGKLMNSDVFDKTENLRKIKANVINEVEDLKFDYKLKLNSMEINQGEFDRAVKMIDNVKNTVDGFSSVSGIFFIHEIKSGLQKAASKTFIPGATPPFRSQVTRDLSRRVRKGFVDSLEGADTAFTANNRRMSNLINFRDRFIDAQITTSDIRDLRTLGMWSLGGHVVDIALASVGLPKLGLVGAVAKQLSESTEGRLLRLQLGDAVYNGFIKHVSKKLEEVGAGKLLENPLLAEKIIQGSVKHFTNQQKGD